MTALVRRSMPALALAGTAAVQLLAVLVLANRVAGGVVAVQLGLTFYFFVLALGATPVAISLLPRLARLTRPDDGREFRETLGRGVALVLFGTVPAAVGYVVLARPLAEVIAVGRMSSGDAVQLVTTAIAALAPGIVGEGLFQVLTYAFYARKDTGAPLRSMGVQVAAFLVLSLGALVVRAEAVPLALGLSYSAATVVGAWHLAARFRRSVGRLGGRLWPSLRRIGAGALLMAGPAWAVSVLVPHWIDGRVGSSLAVIAAAVLGAGVFFGLQAWWRAPELAWITGGIGSGWRRSVPAGRSR